MTKFIKSQNLNNKSFTMNIITSPTTTMDSTKNSRMITERSRNDNKIR